MYASYETHCNDIKLYMMYLYTLLNEIERTTKTQNKIIAERNNTNNITIQENNRYTRKFIKLQI